jgi:hypothetical protein
MKRTAALLLFAAFLISSSGTALAQAQQPPPTFEQALLRQWNNVHNKILAMAKDFPEDKFDSRPHKDSRSFLEEVWHVTATAEWLITQYKNEKVDTAILFSNEGRPRTRAEFVAQLEKAVRECATLIEKQPNPRVISLVEHAGEHYGKMVTIYRMNGLVPPASRAAASN